jgi:hypothetical protein
MSPQAFAVNGLNALVLVTLSVIVCERERETDRQRDRETEIQRGEKKETKREILR